MIPSGCHLDPRALQILVTIQICLRFGANHFYAARLSWQLQAATIC